MRDIKKQADQIFKENKATYAHIMGDLNACFLGYTGSLVDTNLKIEEFVKKRDKVQALYHQGLKKELTLRFLKFCETNKVKFCK